MARPSPCPERLAPHPPGVARVPQASHVSVNWTGDSCAGSGGYADFGPGMGVSVKNEKAEIIGTSTTIQGPRVTAAGDNWRYACEVDFTVPVPTAKFYSIEVGHRGATTYSFGQLVASKWQLVLTLGVK